MKFFAIPLTRDKFEENKVIIGWWNYCIFENLGTVRSWWLLSVTRSIISTTEFRSTQMTTLKCPGEISFCFAFFDRRVCFATRSSPSEISSLAIAHQQFSWLLQIGISVTVMAKLAPPTRTIWKQCISARCGIHVDSKFLIESGKMFFGRKRFCRHFSLW